MAPKTAIIGLSCLFPGAGSLTEYWQALLAGRDCRSEPRAAAFGLPVDRPEAGESDSSRAYSLRGGYVSDFKFDPSGLDLDAEILAGLDSSFLWTLHAARETVRDAGDGGVTSDAGLILGNYTFPTTTSNRMVTPLWHAEFARGAASGWHIDPSAFGVDVDDAIDPANRHVCGMPATLAARALGLHGPSFSLDAACASALYAIDLASAYLRAGKARSMLAGALCAPDPWLIHLSFSNLGAFPPNGISQPFDSRSQGIVTGQGVSIAALKLLDHAIEDGDEILCVIDGVGLSNDGAGRHMLAPNPRGQALAYQRAYTEAAVPPSKIDYVECHATGTPLGDRTETASLTEFFQSHSASPRFGSVKGNLGHLLTVAGMSSLAKVALAMREGTIPATIGIETPSPGVEDLVTQNDTWLQPSDGPRRAAVSSFGFGGANAHMIVSAPPSEPSGVSSKQKASKPIAITGMAAHFGAYATLGQFERAAFGPLPDFQAPSKQRVRGADDVPAGSYVDEIVLDPLSSRVPPAETTHFNPQHALAMRVCEAALHDAGIERKSPAPRNIAVIVALELDLTAHLRRAKAELPDMIARWEATLGAFDDEDRSALLNACGAALHGEVKSAEILSYIGNICAGRISSLWNFIGPSYTVSGDGLGALHAFEAAQMLIAEGRADAAVVAAVDLSGGFADAALSGCAMPGEGAGAVVVTAADGNRRAYARLADIHWCRTHDRQRTLSQLDPSDVAGVLRAAGANRAGYIDAPAIPDGLLPEGAVQSCATTRFGQNPVIAPMAGLIRAALALWRRKRPSEPETLPWIRTSNGEDLRAVVGVEGIGGGYGAIALLEAPKTSVRTAVTSVESSIRFLPVQGENRTALKTALAEIARDLESAIHLGDLQRKWVGAARPGTGTLRAVLVGETRETLREDARRLFDRLDDLIESGTTFQTPGGTYFSPRPLGRDAGIAFVYPGGFNSYPFLGKGLLNAFPDALRRFEAEIAMPAEALGTASIFPNGIASDDGRALMKLEAAMMDDIATMIVSGASYALLYTDILQNRFGVAPSAAYGYSLGETSMLFATHVWPSEARSIDRVRSSDLLKRGIAGPKTLARRVFGLGDETQDRDIWASTVLFADADTVLDRAGGRDGLYVTHVNTPREVVIAGRPAAVKAFAEEIGAQTFRSPISHVLHCDVLCGDLDEVKALNDFPAREPDTAVRLYSARGNKALTQFDRKSLTRNVAEVMCSTVDFRTLTERAYADGARIFIECGPSGTCTRWIGETLAGRPHLALALDQRGADDLKTLYAAMARLFSHGVAVDLSPLTPAARAEVSKAQVHVRTGGAELAATTRDAVATIALPQLPAALTETVEPIASDPPVYGPTLAQLYPGYKTMDTARNTAARKARFSSLAVNSATTAAIVQDLFATEARYLETQAALAQRTAYELRSDTETEAQICALLDLPRVEAAPVAVTSPAVPNAPGPRTAPHADGVIWDEHDLLNFADGKVADIFGDDFAEIDGYPVRVRLPSKPYFFVSRVTKLDATPGLYEPCSLSTEYDIPDDAWYLVDGQMPPGIAVEAGQSDLLLVAYLGIDHKNQGRRKYRLLDGKLAFKGPLPRAGQTLRFDIEITSFVWQGDTLLFFFRYKGYVDGKLALELESGCAGFFTEAELDAGGGVVLKDQRSPTRTLTKPLQRTACLSLGRNDMIALSEGRIADVFGSAHQGIGTSMRLPPEMLLMVDRISDLGSWHEEGDDRVFVLEAEKDLDPNGWYYNSHFVDDPVLPGSLAAEGATQVLKAYLLANGFHLAMADPEFDAIPDLKMDIKVRGQITPKIDTLRYDVRVIETGLLPRPFVRAEVVIWHGDKPLVQISNLGLQIREKASVEPRLGDEAWDSGRRTAAGEKVLLSELHLAHAAKGDLRTAMGKEFGIYGAEHRAPHIPNGCFQFVDRGVRIDGERGALKPGAMMINEYDSPEDAWYYAENSYPRMPNCVYLESALQAAILLGYYLGPTLSYPQNVYSIRNLDGKAVYLADPDTRGKTLRHTETLKSNALIPDSIIQSFDFRIECENTPVYEGWSSFGYFTEKSLAVQLGLDNGKTRRFWDEDHQARLSEIDLVGSDAAKFYTARPGQPHLRLANGRLRLLHKAWMSESGGKHGNGYVRGYRQVRPDDWYFENHFHRDPVQPGSLGLESMLQSIQLYALAHGIGRDFTNPRFGIAVGVPVEWKYRGQIQRKDRDMVTETHIREIRHEPGRIVLIADADLYNGRLPIYQTQGMSVAITEAES